MDSLGLGVANMMSHMASLMVVMSSLHMMSLSLIGLVILKNY